MGAKKQQARARVPKVRKAVRRVVPLAAGGATPDHRVMLVDYLKLLAWWMGRPPVPSLPPRLDLALRCLLRGLSEKEMAREMGVSPFTAHEYSKQLHQRLGVSSRGELLARFLPRARSLESPEPPSTPTLLTADAE